MRIIISKHILLLSILVSCISADANELVVSENACNQDICALLENFEPEKIPPPPFFSPFYIAFRFNSHAVESDYMDNASSLAKLNEILTDENTISRIDSITITAASSPDGVLEHNILLAKQRAAAIKDHIIERYPLISLNKIRTLSLGEDWQGLRSAIIADSEMPVSYKDAAINAIDADVNPSTKEWRLRQAVSGKVWRYIETHHLPYLRAGTVDVTIHFTPDLPHSSAETKPAEVSETSSAAMPADTLSSAQEQQSPQELTAGLPKNELPEAISQETLPEAEPQSDGMTDVEYHTKPLFAVKSNLLFDAVTAINVEVEVPIGTRWSIAGEWMFPWWLWEEKQYCFEVMNGNLEGRYWFGDRVSRKQLTGWFGGVYVGAGYYDLKWKKTGFQGEFFIAAGVSGGYAHTINKSGSLRMEYSLGVGYMHTDYREYVSQYGNDNRWHLLRQGNGSFSWFGPTKAKVSLVWFINHKTRGTER